MSAIEKIVELSASEIRAVFGQYDENVKKIEKTLRVKVLSKNAGIVIVGGETEAARAAGIIRDLAAIARKGEDISAQSVDYALSLIKSEEEHRLSELSDDLICHTVNGKPIKPKTFNQKKYVDAIRNNMVTFGLGPAGTGKTYLAMAMAIDAFKCGDTGRIIMTRPAIEAGENLGFLPGDLQSKVDPYLRPLYDALYQIMGADSFQKNMEKGLIEVAPLAYMRGRTLDNAYIILDEAQNTTPAQMKMFLTRIGFGSKVVITGDRTQKDLDRSQISGLDIAIKVLSKLDDIAFCNLTSRDVVRHPLVQKIVKAYEDYESRADDKNKRDQGRKKK